MKIKKLLIKICRMQQKTVLREKFIPPKTCIRTKERFKISNLGFYLRKLEKEEEFKYKIV